MQGSVILTQHSSPLSRISFTLECIQVAVMINITVYLGDFCIRADGARLAGLCKPPKAVHGSQPLGTFQNSWCIVFKQLPQDSLSTHCTSFLQLKEHATVHRSSQTCAHTIHRAPLSPHSWQPCPKIASSPCLNVISCKAGWPVLPLIAFGRLRQ